MALHSICCKRTGIGQCVQACAIPFIFSFRDWPVFADFLCPPHSLQWQWRLLPTLDDPPRPLPLSLPQLRECVCMGGCVCVCGVWSDPFPGATSPPALCSGRDCRGMRPIQKHGPEHQQTLLLVARSTTRTVGLVLDWELQNQVEPTLVNHSNNTTAAPSEVSQ